VRLEGLGQLNNLVTSSGVEPATRLQTFFFIARVTSELDECNRGDLLVIGTKIPSHMQKMTRFIHEAINFVIR
jgi:hypothetical protein